MQNGFTYSAKAVLRLCSGARPDIKTEPAKIRLESDFRGIRTLFRLYERYVKLLFTVRLIQGTQSLSRLVPLTTVS
jgi:hypothetical protein